MTAKEWEDCKSLGKMQDAVFSGHPNCIISPRKEALFGCACCERVRQMITASRFIRALETVKLWADGKKSKEEMDDRFEQADEAIDEWRQRLNEIDPIPDLLEARFMAAVAARDAESFEASQWAWKAVCYRDGEDPTFVGSSPVERFAQIALLRDIMGNPFLPVTLDPAWLTSTVKQLAEVIYADRAFDRMPILADALEEAGCTNADILNHCRQPGVHVCGCWVVDLLTGRK